MKRLRTAIQAIKEELRAWGMESPRAQDTHGSETLQVYVMTRTGRRVLGTLRKENVEFVFRYDPAFVRSPDALPISAFPSLQEEYRHESLWPFFAVRLPPVERQDVREAMARRQIPKHDVLRMLGELSEKGVSSPYRFSLTLAA